MKPQKKCFGVFLMIKRLKIKGFKAFADAEFELTNLTMLCGLNGSGKSTLVQSILLMREICKIQNRSVPLNGPFNLELGTFENIQNWHSNLPITFELECWDNRSYQWELIGDATSLFANVTSPGDRWETPDILQNQRRGFQYLAAERLGPRIAQRSSGELPENLGVGIAGEYSAEVLHRLGSQPVMDAFKFPFGADDESALLKFQAEQWLSRIARPIQLDTDELHGTGIVSLKFRTETGEWIRSTNMGFGVSYSLPIVLAGLLASNIGILIVENPEAHLHPAGQSNIGYFLSKIASGGTQVILETHSDHVLNGVRRAIAENNVLNHQDASVYYFAENESPDKLNFTPTGGLDNWPKGFFDQYQIDVTALSKVRRRY